MEREHPTSAPAADHDDATGAATREHTPAARPAPHAPSTRAPDGDDEGLRFEDPYWDDAFCAWWDPTLRTCC